MCLLLSGNEAAVFLFTFLTWLLPHLTKLYYHLRFFKLAECLTQETRVYLGPIHGSGISHSHGKYKVQELKKQKFNLQKPVILHYLDSSNFNFILAQGLPPVHIKVKYFQGKNTLRSGKL